MGGAAGCASLLLSLSEAHGKEMIRVRKINRIFANNNTYRPLLHISQVLLARRARWTDGQTEAGWLGVDAHLKRDAMGSFSECFSDFVYIPMAQR